MLVHFMLTLHGVPSSQVYDGFRSLFTANKKSIRSTGDADTTRYEYKTIEVSNS